MVSACLLLINLPTIGKVLFHVFNEITQAPSITEFHVKQDEIRLAQEIED
jgi:hypothetical protein